MKLTSCEFCGMHHFAHEKTCPHCNATATRRRIGGRRMPSAAALLLGLGLTGCGDKSDDTGTSEPAAEPGGEPDYGVPDTSIPNDEPEYGMAMIDDDGDGYYADIDDCDDNNPDIHPGAPETPGDGVDSNCDGNDDT